MLRAIHPFDSVSAPGSYNLPGTSTGFKATFGGIGSGVVEEAMYSTPDCNGSTSSKNDEKHHERTVELTAVKCAHRVKQMANNKNAIP